MNAIRSPMLSSVAKARSISRCSPCGIERRAICSYVTPLSRDTCRSKMVFGVISTLQNRHEAFAFNRRESTVVCVMSAVLPIAGGAAIATMSPGRNANDPHGSFATGNSSGGSPLNISARNSASNELTLVTFTSRRVCCPSAPFVQPSTTTIFESHPWRPLRCSSLTDVAGDVLSPRYRSDLRPRVHARAGSGATQSALDVRLRLALRQAADHLGAT